MKRSTDLMKEIPLTDPKLEKLRYVAMIRYQIPRRIVLDGRRKTSPKFETMYGLIYWLNKLPYNVEYAIFRTDRGELMTSGYKRIGETITYE
jgi:hypothetical protein